MEQYYSYSETSRKPMTQEVSIVQYFHRACGIRKTSQGDENVFD
jgi:hypothetical protein